jgi:hypothetical protein
MDALGSASIGANRIEPTLSGTALVIKSEPCAADLARLRLDLSATEKQQFTAALAAMASDPDMLHIVAPDSVF